MVTHNQDQKAERDELMNLVMFASANPGTIAGMSMYPANPSELGSEWLSKVYGTGDEPALLSIGPGWQTKATSLNCYQSH